MKKTFLVLALLMIAVVARLGSTQQFRSLYYLVGGRSTPAVGNAAGGLYVMDGHRLGTSSLFPPTMIHCDLQSAMMDADNRCLVLVGSFSRVATITTFQNEIVRYDPATSTITTLVTGNTTGPIPSFFVGHTILNQDGDYVFCGATIAQTQPSTLVDYHVFKHRPGAGLTTIFRAVQDLNENRTLYGPLGRNISTGNYLVLAQHTSTIHNWFYGVLELDVNQNGKWTTFTNGGGQTGYGWYQRWGRLWQDYATDALLTEQDGKIFRVIPGTTPMTTIIQYGMPYGFQPAYRGGGVPDLQSSASPRMVAAARFQAGTALTAAFSAIDLQTQAVTAWACDVSNRVGKNEGPSSSPRVFLPYRGRHIASVRAGALRKWTLRFSVPEYAGKAYVAAASITGLRPPVRLADGRRIWIYPDQVTALSVTGQLRPFFDAGPLVLDPNGEAQGTLDLSRLPLLGGQPIWIALAILDPKAPTGIALIPDTYVIRAP